MSLPSRIAGRADVERMLAASANFEQAMPASSAAFDLLRMQRLLEALGHPEREPRTWHVAGSKGKGSTARMLAAGLRAAGLGPVGLTTSPHLADLAERIEVDGRALEDEALCRAFDRLAPWQQATHGGRLAPTFFELVTGAAWVAFRARACRSVVLETGLGGRLDATNVCRPEGTAITTIELEHVALLGDTLEAIAGEKAGILKPGVPCATATTGAALRVIEQRAQALGAPLLRLGQEIELHDVRPGGPLRTCAQVAVLGQRVDLDLPLLGAHQARNAALATALLLAAGLPAAAVREGLAGVRLPASLELFAGRPDVLLDGAHTEASARAAAEAVEAAFPGRPRVLLLALLEEKRVEAILDTLLPGAQAVVASGAPTPRALAAGALALRARARAAPGQAVHAVDEPLAALAHARALCPPGGLVLATGSLSLAGALRSALLREQGPPGPGPARDGGPAYGAGGSMVSRILR
ncbi:MAG: bifunctional folylpolyglutamate synthase/dihydrofolate synthase [Planctomycetia bacterium]